MTREEVIEKLKEYEAKGYEVPDTSLIKTDQQIAGIRKSAVINTGVLDAVAAAIKPGMNTQEIDDIVANYTHEHGAICAPYHYEGFPKHVCTSINHEVCHGIPSRLKHLKDGDIVNVDVSTILDGYYSDASRMFAIGNISNERKRLIEATEKVLQAGIAAANHGILLGILVPRAKQWPNNTVTALLGNWEVMVVGMNFMKIHLLPIMAKPIRVCY